jgi:hypothetical protein
MVLTQHLEQTLDGLLANILHQELDIRKDILELQEFSGPINKIMEADRFVKEKMVDLELTIKVRSFWRGRWGFFVLWKRRI